MIRILMFAAAVAGGWQFETQRDPLGQPVYVAGVVPDGGRPSVALGYSCGGIVGVVLQFNLGDVRYAGMQFSTRDPDEEDVRFAFPEGSYNSTAKRAAITDGLGTYEIKGSEAAFLVGLMKDSERVEITRGDISYTFPLTGAREALDQVLTSCPFRYRE